MTTQDTFNGLETEQAKLEKRAAARLVAKQTKRVNDGLYDMTHNCYHASVPLDVVNTLLTANGFDELEAMILCGREGRLHENVGRNRWLCLTWYKMESGRYEVVAYVS